MAASQLRDHEIVSGGRQLGTVVPVESGILPFDSDKIVATGTTGKNPVVVIAPQQQRQRIGTCL